MSAEPVVVGVDGSEESLQAAQWAALEAERRGSLLRIVTVAAMPARMRAQPGPPRTVADELQEYYAKAVEAAVTRVRQVAPGLDTDTRMLSGPAALAIAQAGSGAALLVVGARGVGGFTALLLGSVSRYVATNAPCPVVVVREQTDAIQHEIAVGVRDPQDYSPALEFAFEEAALHGAELVAVHSCHRFLPGFAGSVTDADGTDTDTMTRSLAEILNGWRDKYPAVTVRPDVVRGHPAQVLAEYSARADLVVIGRHGSGASPSIGSVQHAMLNHARGPVAIVGSESLR